MRLLSHGHRTLVNGCWNFAQKVSFSLTFRAVKRARPTDDREPQLVWSSEDQTRRSTEGPRDTRRETGLSKSLTGSHTDVQYLEVLTGLLSAK
jgi:hypothetical protein